jgi:FtsZ-binding cell division protein ZapB
MRNISELIDELEEGKQIQIELIDLLMRAVQVEITELDEATRAEYHTAIVKPRLVELEARAKALKTTQAERAAAFRRSMSPETAQFLA